MDHPGPRAPQKTTEVTPKRPARPKRQAPGRTTGSILDRSQPHWLIPTVRI